MRRGKGSGDERVSGNGKASDIGQGVRNGESNQLFTLYVDDISARLHWKGLWFAFGRHGDVAEAFIARKRNTKGRRFGFVRYRNRTDAVRATERLNGFFLYGSKISVTPAKYKRRDAYWNKVKPEEKEGEASKMSLSRKEDGEPSFWNSRRKRRIAGHIEVEELRNLKHCLVGETTSVCSVSSVSTRLSEWGLGEIKVQRLGGKTFLLTIEDDELFTMLEDLNWSYLKEIFVSVQMWSESSNQVDRATWIQVARVPLQCWNHITFRRLAELWGKLEAFGENIKHVKDCEKMTILILTSHESRIDETVELEVGNKIYNIRMLELGCIDSQNTTRCSENWGVGKKPITNKACSVSSSSSSSDGYSGQGATNIGNMKEFNAEFFENEKSSCDNQVGEESKRQQLKEEEMIGVYSGQKTWADVVAKNGLGCETSEEHQDQFLKGTCLIRAIMIHL
ncbi:hypothetical protein GQ457_14G001210 [Hibiscus cannabinus]